MKVKDAKAQDYTRALIYGHPGSGKSTLVADLAEAGFYLDWFTLDNDVDTLKKLSPEAQDRVELFHIPDSATFPTGAATMLQVFKNLHGEICDEHGTYSCPLCKKANAPQTKFDFRKYPSNRILVIDTITQIGRSVLAHVTRNQPVDYKPERDDWGSLRKMTEFFASAFQGFQGNLICIAHAAEVEVTPEKYSFFPDFGSKGMSTSISGKFSHSIWMAVENKRHKAFSGSTALPNASTRSRTDFKIEALPSPSLRPLFVPFLACNQTTQSESLSPPSQPSASPVSQTTPAPSPATQQQSSLNAIRERMLAASKK